MKPMYKTLLFLSLFAISMGFLETSVVVYLRKLYYPSGFQFPLVHIPNDIAGVEILREAATISMLLLAGILAGSNASSRFAFFLYSFAVWDLFYYVFLRLLLHWPDSLYTWDILFLIPVPWTGPVLAPCLLSLTMIVLAVAILILSTKGYDTKIRAGEWTLLAVGSLTVIWSFCSDYIRALNAHFISSVNQNPSVFLTEYTPLQFNWQMFGAGETMILLTIILYVMRIRQKEQLNCFRSLGA
jgi:hypothetical protein